ncbi:hypothetical protein [Budvicia diplopodorum]|uniref:hypothetical protein n=1 Tax=Budvicia diplopodorum TaxID=1119056 RepID=UPI001359C939|nr:hypothetical protein [Budvicia diplopodorum]
MFSDLYFQLKSRFILYLTLFSALIASYLYMDLAIDHNVNGVFCLDESELSCDWNYCKIGRQAGLIFFIIMVVQLVVLKVIRLLYGAYKKVVS